AHRAGLAVLAGVDLAAGVWEVDWAEEVWAVAAWGAGAELAVLAAAAWAGVKLSRKDRLGA
ncbi:MAG: hypothetical protein L0Y57_10670, partial [Beijerinckiaceae bacterium]|nr:hypothetical protein [Beijerinckiaceae bacterium]